MKFLTESERLLIPVLAAVSVVWVIGSVVGGPVLGFAGMVLVTALILTLVRG